MQSYENNADTLPPDEWYKLHGTNLQEILQFVIIDDNLFLKLVGESTVQEPFCNHATICTCFESYAKLLLVWPHLAYCDPIWSPPYKF